MGDSALASASFPYPASTDFSTGAGQRKHFHIRPSAADSGEHYSQQVGFAADPLEPHTTQVELQFQNGRLQLLQNLMKQITSSLDLHEVLRSISASLREVMQGDIASVSLHDIESGHFKLFVLDFPQSKGLVSEGLVTPLLGPGRRVLDSLQPVIASSEELYELGVEVHRELASLEGAKSMCVVPLVNRGRALGILAIVRTTERPFAADEVEFLSQVAGPIAIAIDNALAYEEISRLKNKLAEEKLYLEEEIRSEMGFEQIIGNSPALKHVLQLVETVAPSDSTVLLLGETGTGKELIARAIHERSRRKERTFVKLNCAAIPTGLLESELFGHEKGAFTGAISQKVGRMELADQGTLFLDEVGDIPTEIQPKLLRVLQEREFERLGDADAGRETPLVIFHERIAGSGRGASLVIPSDYQTRAGNYVSPCVASAKVILSQSRVCRLSIDGALSVTVFGRIKARKQAVFLRERPVDVPTQPGGYREVSPHLKVVVNVGADGIGAVVTVSRTSELIAPVQLAFYKVLEGREVNRIGICVVIEDIELNVVPRRPHTQDMLSFHPTHGGPVFPLILDHATIAKAGAGTKLQTSTDGRVRRGNVEL